MGVPPWEYIVVALGSFWLVLLVVVGGFGSFWQVPCFSNYGLGDREPELQLIRELSLQNFPIGPSAFRET